MKIIRLLLSMMVLAWSLTVFAASYDELKPLLIDLSGWQGTAAEGSNMDMDGVKMVVASRNYTRGENQTVNIQFGLMPGSMGESMQANMNMETDEVMMNSSTIDEFRVHQNHDKKQNSGIVFVILGSGNEKNSPMFNMSYSGISAEEALSIAKQFDWKKMKTSSEALLH